MADVHVAPSARDITRDYLLTELALHGITMTWTTQVPFDRPDRFGTLEELNAVDDFGFIAESQLIQLRFYDVDAKRCAATARLGKGIWKGMPAGGKVVSVEIAGGPTYQNDPDVPQLTRYLITGWVTVMNEQISV